MTEKQKKLKISIEKCKGCALCIKVCPQKSLEMSQEVNKRGMQYVILKHPEKCNKCGLCFMVCPDCAIEVEEE
ncbi:MAG: 4Fe-4S binding protein [Candidatus Omnitrophica bacterium]|nr:4Fe-4S binding protein [Candidatus Omnitrophota bacterium]